MAKTKKPTTKMLEPKYAACKRLEAEGRYAAFLERKAFFRSRAGGGFDRDVAFYKALAEFPPQGE